MRWVGFYPHGSVLPGRALLDQLVYTVVSSLLRLATVNGNSRIQLFIQFLGSQIVEKIQTLIASFNFNAHDLSMDLTTVLGYP